MLPFNPRLSSLALVTSLAVSSACGPVELPTERDVAPADGDEPTSVHGLELARHRGEPLAPRELPDGAVLRDGQTKTVKRVVYGYYPYWAKGLASIRWSALTHLAWFAIELDQDGQAVAKHGWPDDVTVSAAHQANVRVDLSFTLFSGSGILTLCQDPARRAAAIETMIDLLEAGGADGISVDFEGLKAGTRDAFSTFISELRGGLDARGHPTAEIAIAGPTVDWTDSFDVAALFPKIDHFFMMGYGIFWTGSANAGPSGLWRTTETFRPYSGESTLRGLAHYAGLLPAASRAKLIYGVPYYGNEWTTASSDVAAATVASVGAVTYSGARAALAAGAERQWLADVSTPWYAVQENGVWHETYYEDEESLAVKYQLALDQDLGGVGMWALNFDKGHDELWDVLEAKLGVEPPTPPGHRAAPLPIDHLPFHDARDTHDGPTRYFDYYACKPTAAEYGPEWVYALDVCQPGALTAHVTAGGAGVDPDLHLLTGPTQEACIARDDAALALSIDPGHYLLVVDTFVADRIEQEGPYELDVDFVPEAGSSPCAVYLACQGGACVCADAAKQDCGSACVDVTTDAAHCGACGQACDPTQTCEKSVCVGGVADGGAPDADAGGTGGGGVGGGTGAGGEPVAAAPSPAASNAGCGCSTPASSAETPWLVLALTASCLARRRRRALD